ncbi:MAG: Maf family protein [Geminicoccaceae bacterium]|nr:Maf family protein [Geminicoccaceae bacterium]MCB9966323.1 Maf family protein [Geminicoccaceae bacterium]HRY27151.1 Maf family protein [Geminicoccaceae bacterium]
MTTPLQAATPPLILASGSAARAAMLRAAGLEFQIAPAPVDEVELRLALLAEGIASPDAATALAELKAQHVAARQPGDCIVLGADQLLELDGAWLEKPVDRAAAARQLAQLGGRAHRLVSAVVAFRGGARVWHHVASAEITLRALSAGTIEAYLDAAGEAALRSVGAYELEGLGAQLVTAVRGDHFTVLGLPLLPLLRFLRDQGVLLA